MLTVFHLITALDAYSVLKVETPLLIRGQSSKEDGVYNIFFKIWKISIFLNKVLYKAICKLFSNMKNKHFEVKVCTKQDANCLLKAVKTVFFKLWRKFTDIPSHKKRKREVGLVNPSKYFAYTKRNRIAKTLDREIRMLREMRNYFLYK